MNFFNKKLAMILFETDATKNRLRPATITMKRGTVIEADHVRQVMIPGKSGDLQIIIAGIQPGKFESIWSRGHIGICQRFRDFYFKQKTVPMSWLLRGKKPVDIEANDFVREYFKYSPSYRQDDYGWYEPRPDGRYDASRAYMVTRKFNKILTMNPKNIDKIEYSI